MARINAPPAFLVRMLCMSPVQRKSGNVSLLHTEMFIDNMNHLSFPVAQMVEHGASNAKIMGSFPRESKSWSNVKL